MSTGNGPQGSEDHREEVARLRAEVARLRELLDVTQEFGRLGVWERDVASLEGRWDRHVWRFWGLPAGSLPPTFSQAIEQIHPEDRPGLKEAFDASITQPGNYAHRYRVLRPDGSTVHLHSQWRVLADERGAPKRVVGVMVDDTDSINATRAFESAADAAEIGLWSTRDLELPQWSPRMYRLMGQDPTKPTLRFGEWIRTCVHPGDRDRVARQAQAWLRRGAGDIEIEFRVQRADGAVRHLVVRGLVETAMGHSLAHGIAMDVTVQQETVEALRQSLARAQMISGALGLGTWDYDLITGASTWNEQMFRLRGLPPSDRALEHEERLRCLHPDDAARVTAEQERMIVSNLPWSTEFRVLHPDGTVRWLGSRSAPLFDSAGNQVRRIGVNWDITDAKRTEEALREREIALGESRAKSRFLSRMSHELRTPLNAVLGFTQLLAADQGQLSAQSRSSHLAHIEAAGRHLLSLINDVLDLSRLQADEMKLESEPLDMARLVDDVLPMVSTLARERDVVLRRGEVRGVVLADPTRARQVLINLLSNAIKYNRKGGSVDVRAETVGTMVQLVVRDTGRGMSSAQLTHAFEPFNRLGLEGSGIEGTGVGLAIVKSLVEHMGGTVTLQSAVGLGTEFVIELPAVLEDDLFAEVQSAPLKRQSAGPAHAASAFQPSALPDTDTDTPRGWAQGTVLYIEDNPVNALIVQELLKARPGVEVTIAEDGQSGLELARALKPDLTMIDMQLPDISGQDVLDSLRRDPSTQGLHCVALSANAMPEDIEQALASGFDDYWTKPLDFEPFLRALDRMLGPQA